MPSPLGLLEERRESARARVEGLETRMALLEKELEEARVVLERRVVAVEELTAALAPAEEPASAGAAAAATVQRVPPKGAVVPRWCEGLDPAAALASDYRRLVEAVETAAAGGGGLSAREVAEAMEPGRKVDILLQENLRTKAKRLVERGWLAVDGSGCRFMPRRPLPEPGPIPASGSVSAG
ncbi:hypothetical protein [Peterkaempfera sp. SMS 1(5)a]|uniref:hypothetical protein n=1 Tax=Peterkaempfera podocarpi TaxID=3232308 RepID=UPI00366F3CAB